MRGESLSAETFFGWVDELLTPPMLALGYHRIGGYSNDQPFSRSALQSAVPGSDDVDAPSVPFLVYDFGYEAGSDEAAQRVDPTDPGSADELWLSFEPRTGELELSSWDEIAASRVAWDIRSDNGPCSPFEIRRRLADLGGAVNHLAESAD